MTATTGRPSATAPFRANAAPRVALIGPVTPLLGGTTPGGVATHQVHLAEGLRAAGVEAPLLATNAVGDSPAAGWSSQAPFPLLRPYQPGSAARLLDPAYLHAVGFGRAARYAALLAKEPTRQLGSRRAVLTQLLWYRRFLALVRPAVVHVQHPLERHLYVRLVQRYERWRVPTVVTVHGLFDEQPEAVIHELMGPNLRAADRVIAVSRHIADQTASLGVPRERIRVIRSGVDSARFHPRDRTQDRQYLGLSQERPVVLFVGNLEPRKAVDRLLQAIDHVRESVPDVLLAIIGTGQSAGVDDQEPRLRSIVRERQMGDSARFLGRVSEEDLLAWYGAADVFALPSSSEAQGIVALEAMAIGLPVVVSAVGGLLDTVEDGSTGYLVPFGDTAGFAERLLGLLADPVLRKRIGEAGRTAVAHDFSWERSVQATIDVYRELAPRS